ncbi:MAG: NUDIX hydrolase [Chloroflexi bacterium]|nr:NUDIX hydrolase [Chloroflexota bacterium]
MQETGIIALPVRLVSLNFWSLQPDGLLTFTFRCLRRGGELQTSPESPKVGFFSVHSLPNPMLAMSRKRLQRGLQHAGGPVEWWAWHYSFWMRVSRFLIFNVLYRWLDLKRKIKGQPPYIPPPTWEIGVYTAVQNGNNEVLWRTDMEGDLWHLPGGQNPEMTPPWDTAVSLTQQQTGLKICLTDLSGVYVAENSNRMALLFTAVVEDEKREGETANSTVLSAGVIAWSAAAPEDAPSQHKQYVEDAALPDNQTNFRLL